MGMLGWEKDMKLSMALALTMVLAMAVPSFAQNACDAPSSEKEVQACYSELDFEFERNAMATAFANLEFQLFDDPENDESRKQCYVACRNAFRGRLIGCEQVFGQWDTNETFEKTHNVCRSSAREKLSACLKPFASCG